MTAHALEDDWLAGLEDIAPEAPKPGADNIVELQTTQREPHRKLQALDLVTLMATDPPPVPWQARGFLVRGAVTMLSGREGLGKSMFGLGVAAATSHGATIAGIACQPGHVTVIDAENGQNEAHRRLKGMAVNPARMTYAIAEGFNLLVDLPLVEQIATETKPAVIILDSFRSLAPGLEENDSGPVELILGPLRTLARRSNAAVLLLHHESKTGGYRGSTAIGAAVELGFTLSRDADDPDQRRRKLTCWKCRPAQEPEPRWILLDQIDGYCTIDEAEPWEPPRTSGTPARDALVARITGVITTGGMSRADLLRAAGRDPKDRTGRRAIDEMLKAGTLAMTPDGLLARGVASGGATPDATQGVAGGAPPFKGDTCHPPPANALTADIDGDHA